MNPDHRDLDGRLLELLVTVLDEGSITRAAARLNVTQSAVSHLLDKLRAITGDALFVKSGRGIVATARAEAMAAPARALLEQMQHLARSDRFDPAALQLHITVAANDLQRDLLLPGLLRRLRVQAPGVRLHVMPSDVPSAEMLREQHCQLVISPRPPEGSDILQRRLFTDRWQVYFDPVERAAPRDLADYLESDHVSVLYHRPRRALDVDDHLAAQGISRRIVATVPGFAGVPALLRGSAALATAPSLLRHELMRGFALAEVPTATPELPMYMVWHLRHPDDPVHQWLRGLVDSAAAEALAADAAATRH